MAIELGIGLTAVLVMVAGYKALTKWRCKREGHVWRGGSDEEWHCWRCGHKWDL